MNCAYCNVPLVDPEGTRNVFAILARDNKTRLHSFCDSDCLTGLQNLGWGRPSADQVNEFREAVLRGIT